MVSRLLKFALAWAVTYVLASVAASQAVLAYLARLGREIGFAERMGYWVHDVLGMLSSYALLLLIALLIAFPVAGLIARNNQTLRLIGFVLAGFVGVVAMHLIMQATLGLNPVWATNFTGGLLLQGLAGAVGGYLYQRLQRPVAV